MTGLSAAISGIGSAVGRYFSIVSFVPSLFLVSFVFWLIESGSWGNSHQPDWARATGAFTHIGDIGLLILISVGIGIIAHPLQFTLVQLFEGYWGTNKYCQRLRVMRILHHSSRCGSLRYGGDLEEAILALQNADEAAKALQKAENGEADSYTDAEVAQLKIDSRLGSRVRARYRSLIDESDRLSRSYPDENIVGGHSEYDDVMPTRLGNVLRKYERQVGSQYRLDLVSVIQHVAFVAPAERLDYVSDQRQLLDLSVRMSATSALATLAAVAFLWQHGLWLLVALGPYGIAYLSYRGAIIVAHEYGAALSAMIDLDRFALYDQLRLRQPKNTEAERKMNVQLMRLITNKSYANVRYEHPRAPDNDGTSPKAP